MAFFDKNMATPKKGGGVSILEVKLTNQMRELGKKMETPRSHFVEAIFEKMDFKMTTPTTEKKIFAPKFLRMSHDYMSNLLQLQIYE